jgi:hypothetical protein
MTELGFGALYAPGARAQSPGTDTPVYQGVTPQPADGRPTYGRILTSRWAGRGRVVVSATRSSRSSPKWRIWVAQAG